MNNTKLLQALKQGGVQAFKALDHIRICPISDLSILEPTISLSLATPTSTLLVAYNILCNRLYGYVCTNTIHLEG